MITMRTGWTSGCTLAAFAGLFWASSLPVYAQTWTGAASDSWSNPLNWSTGTVPTTGTVNINTITANPAVADGVVYPSATIFAVNIGSTVGSQGSLTLKNGSVFQISTLGVGNSGTGFLNIYDSQVSVTNTIQVGNFGRGSLTVSGNSTELVLTSSVPNSGYIQIGGFAGGYGTFLVSDGATVTAQHVIIGNGRGSGDFVVDGGHVTLAQDLTVVGQTGDTSVVVRNGGTISLGRDFDLGSFSATTTAFLTLTGTNSKISNTQTSTIGWDGKGIALISDKGAYEANDIAIGYFSTGNGLATVTGGASIKATDILAIGYFGTGTLTLQEGGKASAATLAIAAMTAGNGVQSQGVLNIGGVVGGAATAPGTVSAGRVEFGSGQGAINFNHTATDYVFDAAISDGIYGNGIVNAIAGRTILENNHTGFTGVLQSSSGILQVNGNISNGTVSILSEGKLEGIGRVGNTVNAGIIAPGNSIGTLTIAGNYTGTAGSSVWIEAVLGGDTSPTDRLVITGNTSGTSSVVVTNVGGIGAPTAEGIKIIEVGGASNGHFSLMGDYVTSDGQQAVIGGAYAYTLHQNGVSNPTDGNWYLRSQMIAVPERLNPAVPLYESYPQVLLLLNNVSTLQERVGNRYWSGAGNQFGVPGIAETDASYTDGTGMWGRIEGGRASFDAVHSTSGASRDIDFWKTQAGLDLVLRENPDGSLLVGSVILHYGQSSADVKSVFGRGSIDTTGYGIGTALTWYEANGFYVDGQAHYSWYESDLKSRSTGRTENNDGIGYALSIETGRRIILGNGFSVTPQAQLVYSNVDLDSFTDSFGAKIELNRADSLKARLGVSLDKETAWIAADGTKSRSHIYGIANLYNEFLDGSQVDVSGVKFTNRDERLWGGIGAGASYNWSNDKYSLYGKVNVSTGLEEFADSNVVSGSIGFRARW